MRFLAALLCVFAAQPAFSTPEEIRIGSLGARGVVFRDPHPGYITEYLSAAGDVNGDGLADFLLLWRDRSADFEGQIFLVHGAADLPQNPSFAEISARSTVVRLTHSVGLDWVEGMTPLGDVDSDGFDDFIIQRPYAVPADWPFPGVVPGVVHVVYGATTLPPALFLEEAQASLRVATLTARSASPAVLGVFPVTRRGDLNGDGQPDLALGAALVRGDELPGRVYVLFGGTPLEGEIDVEEIGTKRAGIVLDGEGDEGFGSSVEYAGDVNGDGFDDLLIGALRSRTGPPGGVYLLFGARDLPARLSSTEILDSGRGTRFEKEPWWAETGRTLGAAGDLNGDGLDDFLIGAPGAGNESGAVYLLYGRKQFPDVVQLDGIVDQELGVIFQGEGRTARPPASSWGRTGEAIAVLDQDGDGRNDFLIGAPRFEQRGVAELGRAYVVLGEAFAPASRSLGEIESGDLRGAIFTSEVSQWLGSTAAAPGDINGDGHPDILLSAPFRYRGFDTVAPGIDGKPGVDGNASVYLVYGSGAGPGPLALDDVHPAQAPLAGGIEVTLVGGGFDASTTVEIGGRAAPVKRIETTARIVVTAPPGETLGPVDVVVIRDGESRSLKDVLRYVPRFYPEIRLNELPALGGAFSVESPAGQGPLDFFDWDSDGLADLVETFSESQGVFVVYGSRDSAETVQLPAHGDEIPPDSELAFLQVSAAGPGRNPRGIGDVNGDGRLDLAIAETGLVRVLFGGERETGWIDTGALVLAGRGADILVPGVWVPRLAGGSDLDGDGILDFAIAQYDGLAGKGQVWIAKGRKDWPQESFLDDLPRLESRTSQDSFGRSLALPGDVDGDGVGDLLVGAPGQFWLDDGNAYMVFGRHTLPEGFVEDAVRLGGATRIDAFKHKDSLGRTACAPGDVNGDGVSDVALAAEGGGVEFAGESYVIFGGPSLAGSPGRAPVDLTSLEAGSIRITGAMGYDYAFETAPAGDFNGDGLADLLVGAFGHKSKPSVYVVFGDIARHVDLGDLGGDGVRIVGLASLGYYLAGGGGDFNGDGRDDIVIGEASPGAGGRAIIIFGEPAPGTFIRGDSNRDGKVQLSDAVYLLGFLFLGSEAPACLDAADSNDDGKLDLTDAVYVLGHLFLGGPAPPEPFSKAGADLTLDSLDCGG